MIWIISCVGPVSRPASPLPSKLGCEELCARDSRDRESPRWRRGGAPGTGMTAAPGTRDGALRLRHSSKPHWGGASEGLPLTLRGVPGPGHPVQVPLPSHRSADTGASTVVPYPRCRHGSAAPGRDRGRLPPRVPPPLQPRSAPVSSKRAGALPCVGGTPGCHDHEAAGRAALQH